jgi:hypothetical protein
MAFPGTYNFNYYRGDTFEFIIRPKDGVGDIFPLDGYTASMTIADKRGATGTQYLGVATVNTVDNIITCVITPAVGRSLTTANTWVYDVQIETETLIYTLLNGLITVTEDVTGAV